MKSSHPQTLDTRVRSNEWWEELPPSPEPLTPSTPRRQTLWFCTGHQSNLRWGQR